MCFRLVGLRDGGLAQLPQFGELFDQGPGELGQVALRGAKGPCI
jgi:hypothetical protein